MQKTRQSPLFLGVVHGCTLKTYRVINGYVVPWRVVVGDSDELYHAIQASRELAALAAETGGWLPSEGLGLDPPKPVKASKPRLEILSKDPLDSGFR